MIKVYPQLFAFLVALQFYFPARAQDFLATQLKFSRVRAAKLHVQSNTEQLLSDKKIGNRFELFLRAFKQEGVLEVWVRNKQDKHFIHLTDYDFCTLSGRLGPKRKAGDGQVPEGVYYIDRFNPQSNFHLSLGVSYPNASDRILGVKGHLGGDIFIHGSCVSIGCIPITNPKIEQLYWLAILARNGGQQQIPVHIFPFRLNKGTNPGQTLHDEQPDKATIAFWGNLTGVYNHFEKTRTLPDVGVDAKGKYFLRKKR